MFLNKRIDKRSLLVSTITQASTSLSQDLDYAEGYCVMCVISDTTPGAKTFAAAAVNTTTHAITLTAHGFATGLVTQVANAGTLPTGISASTNYYVIVVDANTFQLATSLSNANAGTAIAISAQGSGTNTITPTALAGATVKLQASLDNTNWADVANSVATITTTGNVAWNYDAPYYSYVQVVYAVTSGQLAVQTNITVKAFT